MNPKNVTEVEHLAHRYGLGRLNLHFRAAGREFYPLGRVNSPAKKKKWTLLTLKETAMNGQIKQEEWGKKMKHLREKVWHYPAVSTFGWKEFVIFLTFILVLVLPATSLAHSIFIQSGRYLVNAGKGSPLFFCYGHHFPVDDAVRREKLSYVKIIDPDRQATEVQLRDEKSLHSYVVTYNKPGTYVLVAETNPGYFAMYADKKGRKRHSLKPLNTFIENAQSVESSMRSSQWTKTYVVCDTPSRTFPAEVGLPLELLAEKDPSSLKVGDTISFKVYFDGKQYTGQGFWDATYSGFSTEAEDMYIQRTPVTGGKFTVSMDASGRWFVRFFSKTDAPEDKKNEYFTEKRTTSLTFEVRNERKRTRVDDH